MQEIKPVYVNFTQAKLLKDKGFNLECVTKFLRGEPEVNGVNNRFFGEPLEDIIERPEQWQVVEWLRLCYNIDLHTICNYSKSGRTYRIGIIFINKYKEIDTIFLRPEKNKLDFIEFNTPQEALSAAFDHTLIKILN